MCRSQAVYHWYRMAGVAECGRDLSGPQCEVLSKSLWGGLLSPEPLYQKPPKDPKSIPSVFPPPSEQNYFSFLLLPFLLGWTTLTFCACGQVPQQQLLTRGSKDRLQETLCPGPTACNSPITWMPPIHSFSYMSPQECPCSLTLCDINAV